MRLVRQTFRIDAGTAEALRRRAEAEHTSVPDLMREAIRLRLDVGAVSDLVRVAVADVVAHAQVRIDALGTEWRDRFIETEERERGTTRRDIEDFIGGLNELEQARSGRAPSLATPHDPLSK
jgi:hypothetical protein